MSISNYYEPEIWVSVNGYDGYYEVSNHGRVRRVGGVIPREGHGGRMTIRAKILRPYKDTRGYLMVRLSARGVSKICLVHRLVGIHFLPNDNNLPEINHKLGDKNNNRSWMLEWATRKTNMTHAAENGLLNLGSRSYMSKLTEKQVSEILVSNLSQRTIAKQYSVSRSTIQCIKNGRSWKRQHKEYKKLL